MSPMDEYQERDWLGVQNWFVNRMLGASPAAIAAWRIEPGHWLDCWRWSAHTPAILRKPWASNGRD